MAKIDIFKNKFIQGVIGKRRTEVGLTDEQAFEIALQALKRKLYTQASTWLIAVFDMIDNTESTLDRSRVIDAINMLTREVLFQNSYVKN